MKAIVKDFLGNCEIYREGEHDYLVLDVRTPEVGIRIEDGMIAENDFFELDEKDVEAINLKIKEWVNESKEEEYTEDEDMGWGIYGKYY